MKEHGKSLKTGYRENFAITYREGLFDPSGVIDRLSKPSGIVKKGRGEIKIISMGDTLLACRKYMHGGLLRGITGERFLNEKRAAEELQITMYLEANLFPVVSPFGYVVEKHGFEKTLYFITFFVDNAVDLMDFFKGVNRKRKLRAVKDLARLFFDMANLGVFHPDFHLRNVMVDETGALLFLDFDRARRKEVTAKDMIRMFWRLNRFVEKRENMGEPVITMQDKVLFLRTFERLSGYNITGKMQRQERSKQLSYRLGWFLDTLLYKKTGVP